MQTAVLFRDNDSSVPIIDRMDREKVGYRARGLDSVFFSNQVVLNIAGIMKFAMGNCADRAFFEKNYYKLGLFINRNQAEFVLKSCPVGKNIIKFISDNQYGRFPERAARKAAKTLENYDIIQNYTGGAETAVYAIIYGLSYKDYLEEFGKSTAALRIILQIAEGEPSSKRLIARLDELKEIVARGGTDSTSRFTLSTVHSSKGLEYDRVIIIDAYEGSFPKADKNVQREECQLPMSLKTRACK